MEEAYERQLDLLAEAAGPDQGRIALVSTIPLQQAAALASDLAQTIASRRPGHTLLISLEDGPSRLDHEIGVEGGGGLTDVLRGRATMSRVAARARARRFIYVPAGAAPADAAALVRSRAWEALVAAARRGRGTVLAFLAVDVLEDLARPPRPVGRFDAVVWLGGEPPGWAGPRAAAAALGMRELGALPLPGGAVSGLSQSPPRAKTADATGGGLGKAPESGRVADLGGEGSGFGALREARGFETPSHRVLRSVHDLEDARRQATARSLEFTVPRRRRTRRGRHPGRLVHLLLLAAGLALGGLAASKWVRSGSRAANDDVRARFAAPEPAESAATDSPPR